MKRLFTLLIIGSASFGFAQSFSLYKTNGTSITSTITNGSTVYEVSTASGQVTTKVRIKNHAASTQTFSVLRTVLSGTPALDLSSTPSNPTTYFCFGYSCFTSNVNSAGPGDYTILTASGQTSTAFPNADNSDANGQPFSIYLDEGATTGMYSARYKVFRVDNPNDTVSFIVSYNIPAGIKAQQKSSLSLDLVPNPASAETKICINAENNSVINISLTNIAGQKVYESKQHLIPGKNTLALETDKFTNGVYFVTVENDNIRAVEKLIIAK